MTSLIQRFSILLLMSVLVRSALAEVYARSVSFEWDPIEGAEMYELVIRTSGPLESKEIKFKLRENSWSGRLPPGRYQMTTRSLDRRGVPGEWASPMPFDVNLEKPVLLLPKDSAVVLVQKAESSTLTFTWKAVGGAIDYEFEVRSRDGMFVKKESTKELSRSIELPVAKSFEWKVRASGQNELASETIGSFSHVGARIEGPKFEIPENEFVRDLKWEVPAYAGTYEIDIQHLNEQKRKWETMAQARRLKESSYPVALTWPGGVYQATVKAKGELRQDSPEVRLRFRVRPGDRSPASEFTAEVRKSIDRVNGWYGIASYLMTVVSYSSTNFDDARGAATKFEAIGGTGRLGMGYFLRDRAWGFLGIADLSGFTNDQGKNLTYAASELNAVWRSNLSMRSELRLQLGGFYKEQPVALGESSSLKVSSYSNVSALGPHGGAELWYSLSPKLGFQINAHLYQSLMALSTPNGKGVEPTLSSQLGFLGSYRLGPRATGLMGYARRDDRTRYVSITGKSNKIEVSGNYLNFFLEYGF
jgi:hypothetical protein